MAGVEQAPRYNLKQWWRNNMYDIGLVRPTPVVHDGMGWIIGFGDYTDLLWWKWFEQLVLPIDH